ncbi:MAG: M3 family metallopeptidase [Prevotellaceae bacterium]|jgi:peptidyl-dipeptidase Dcp|nr:M3 family metallopeptidase [Prevotellaceae bacterium]
MKLKHISSMIFACTLMLSACNEADLPPAQAAWPEGDNPFFHEYETPFNVPPFDRIEVGHYMPAFEAGMKNQMENIELIINQTAKPTFVNTIEAFDGSGELLTRVRTVFSCLTSANTNEELEQLNAQISPVLSKHFDGIFMNKALFERVKTVYDNKSAFKLDGEQSKLLDETYKTFIRSGINLDDDKQARLREVNERLSTLTVKFGQNLLAENNRFQLVIDKKSDLAGLPESSIAAAAAAAKNKGMEGKWLFTLHNPSALPFLQYADNRSLREKIYKGYTNKCDHSDDLDNNATAAEIAALRVERAELLGYANHAAYVLEESMAKTPEAVNKFLAELWTPALAVAKNEAEQMQTLMNEVSNNAQSLEAWDWQYYAEKVRQAKYKLDAEALRPYFKLENVRDGIFTLCDKLYGLKFEQISEIPLYHPEAVAYQVKNSDNSQLGLLYMEFHPRESKRSGAWMTSYRKESYKDGRRVAPVISIVCNFTRPSADTPALLTADEVETFFHEFGHALHGLMANTKYYSLSGTSVPRDFVELPSQIMENWAFEPEMLALYATHYQTGEIIPDELVKKMDEASKFNQGFATVEYLAASILDMNYHTLSDKTLPNVVEFEKAGMDAIGLIRQIAPRYRSTYFQHIFSGGYSAGYYSYIWAEVLDSDAFAKFKESGDIFNREIAASFRKNILEQGGTKDPMEMYKAFRGAEPEVKHLLKKRGLDL